MMHLLICYQYASVAQLVEQLPRKQWVTRSSRARSFEKEKLHERWCKNIRIKVCKGRIK